MGHSLYTGAKSHVTVHSGILKNSGEKGYDPYLSNGHKHDQVFVHLAIE